MQRFLSLLIILFIVIFIKGCNNIEQKNWIDLIPEKSTFLIIPDQDVDLSTIGSTDYASILEDLTPSALQQLGALPDSLTQAVSLESLALFPAASTDSYFIWIASTDVDLNYWAPNFYEPFEQNYYSFNGLTIHKIYINDYLFFASQVHNWLVLSESSLAVESALRSYLGMAPSMKLNNVPAKGQLIVNSEKLDHWVQQFIAVGFRPGIMSSFTGFEPAQLRYNTQDDERPSFEFEGTIPLNDTTKSVLVDALSSENREISLDRYIAGNSAAFVIMRADPKIRPQFPNEFPSSLDTLFITDSDLYRELALATDKEFALVAFPESGLLANGEFLYLRKLSSSITFRNTMEILADSGYVLRQGNSYYVKSKILSELLGSDLSNLDDFYLSISRDVAIISDRRGLSESVDADRTRRRTIYYNETFSDAKEELPDEISGLVWAKTSDFLKFLEPFLMTNTPIDGLLGTYDITQISFERNSNQSVEFTFSSISEEGSIQPYDELWVLPLPNEELSAQPVLENIIGSETKEIIYSTLSGNVEALAFDGTSVMQAKTDDGDIPIGSPVIFDWYGNGQPIIIQAAGTKIYAWNEGGNSLPQFPIEIGEQISAPIVVTDVLRNGIPEIIVATENRKIHIIDGRGQNIRGWPQFTNAIVTMPPVYELVNDEWAVWVYSQNILHSWQRNGTVRPGFPTFINASFTTAPTLVNDHVLGAGSDGYIYSIGEEPSFKDSLAISIQMDSISIKSLYATSSRLNKISVEPNILLRDSTGFYRNDLYVTQSVNGSILMFNPNGELRVTHNLGQPSSDTFTPMILDINRDRRQEVIALADFGRLFAWEIISGRRIFSIPTSGMTHPVISDLNNDGFYELIAQTREGLRCWTINQSTD